METGRVNPPDCWPDPLDQGQWAIRRAWAWALGSTGTPAAQGTGAPAVGLESCGRAGSRPGAAGRRATWGDGRQGAVAIRCPRFCLASLHSRSLRRRLQ